MRANPLTRAAVAGFMVCVVPSLAVAGPPTDWVRAAVVEAKKAVSQEGPDGKFTPEKRAEIGRLAEERFDFPEMARLALGQHWRQRSPEEQAQFVKLFRNLLQQSHFMNMITKVKAEQRFVGERIEGNRAVVQAVVEAEGNQIPVDYALVRHNGGWKIYDLGVDGMRLSQIYRAQFNKVISTTSYTELVRRMQVKLQEVAYEGGGSR